MKILDGKKLKAKKMKNFKKRVFNLSKPPHLVMIQIGNNLASNIYLKHKQNTCKELGIKATKINFSSSIKFLVLKKEIEKLNNDKNIDGVLVQFPLPSGISQRNVALLIDPQKDVDGIHPFNQGINVTNTNLYSIKPCTSRGVMEILKEYKIKVNDKHIVVIGRSNIAGRPISNMLINANATVSQIHSKTPKKLKMQLIKQADIIVTATGYKDIFMPKDVKKNVVIVDIGIIKENQKLRGDIKYKAFKNKASYITPVPGGIGPMTIAMLMDNIISIKENKMK